jgi:hypothetical protein
MAVQADLPVKSERKAGNMLSSRTEGQLFIAMARHWRAQRPASFSTERHEWLNLTKDQ